METLTDRRREALDGPVTEQRRRFWSRLRLRFDICFVLTLALAVLAWLGIDCVSITALVLSPTVLAVGYLITVSPLRGRRFARWPLLSRRWDAELMSWLWARRALLASALLAALTIAAAQ